MSRGLTPIIVTKQESHLATSERELSQQEGLHGRGEPGRPVLVAESKQKESQKPSGPHELESHPTTSNTEVLASVRKAREEANLEAWRNRNAKKIGLTSQPRANASGFSVRAMSHTSVNPAHRLSRFSFSSKE